MSLSIPAQLLTAVKNRERYFQRLQTCYDLIKDGESTKTVFLERAKLIDDAFNKFEAYTDKINLLNNSLLQEEEEHKVSAEQAVIAFESLYFKIKAHESFLKQQEKESSLASTSSNVNSETIHSSISRIKLPVINIPIFSGDITKFTAWRSLYDELIHSNNELTDIQKFSYLKAYLDGPATSCIESVPLSGPNYPLAYQNVVERYSKKRILASHHFNKLLGFQPLNKCTLSGLYSFLDNFHVPVESMKTLAIANLGEFILLHLGLRALDPETSKEFEHDMVNTTFPSFEDLVAHVKKKCSILELSAGSTISNIQSVNINKPLHKSFVTVPVNGSQQPTSLLKQPSLVSNSKENKNKCVFCSQTNHRLQDCPKFLHCPTSKRFNIVKDLRVCFGCLSPNHSRPECRSRYACNICGKTNHHTLLHHDDNSELSRMYPSSQSQPVPQPLGKTHMKHSGVVNFDFPSKSENNSCEIDSKNPKTIMMSSIDNKNSSTLPHVTVLLGTATMKVKDNHGHWHLIRGVIDGGSQISAISENLAQLLKLPRQKSNILVSGIGSEKTIQSRGEVSCCVLPYYKAGEQDPIMNIQTVVLPKITAELTSKIPESVLKSFTSLKLADTTYYHPNTMSSQIDMLIGAEYYAELLESSLPIIPGSPSAIPTKLGWLLMGRVNNGNDTTTKKSTSLFISTADPVSTQLEKFWELETIPCKEKFLRPEDELCEKHFCETVQRTETGRYMVSLPFKQNLSTDLGSNRHIAIKRLYSLENKFQKNADLKILYDENLQSYLDSDHMEISNNSSQYLLVHHGVTQQLSSTTKLRVVFNPNIVGSSGKSLSDILMVGPKLQSDIADILINFRLHKVALTTDIQAMYRSILLNPEDRHYQHLLYRFNGGELCEYELKTVTFGLPPSPFQAQRVIQQLLLDEGKNFPRAAAALKDAIFVDDIVLGGDSIEDVKNLQQELVSLFDSGGFKLRKWASSSPEVLENISKELLEKPHKLGGIDAIKILGLQWYPENDSFSYVVSSDYDYPTTKRQVLSKIASIYDVNGFLSPITVYLKIFMQQVWLQKELSWDSKLPTKLQEHWDKIMSEIDCVQNIRIQRPILSSNPASLSIIGFADASGAAMAAVVYLRVVTSDQRVETYLLRARTKVAPLKTITVNKLELCAAVLLANLVKSLSFIYEKLKIDFTYLFSDSSTVLAWLKTPIYLLKIFVANRVTQILEITDPSQWKYVSTHENSADIASRGVLPSRLLDNDLWFHGPDFLKQNIDQWFSNNPPEVEKIPEIKPLTVSLVTNLEKPDSLEIFEKYSSLFKLEKVIALILRFSFNARHSKDQRRSGSLSLSELKAARNLCIKRYQQVYFSNDLKLIATDKQCSHALQSLSPRVNNDNILVVGGRLSQSQLPESAKHPILLPKCHLSTLIINYYHFLSLHGGPKLVQSLIQRQYWITGLRSFIRQTLHKCVPCFRASPRFTQPLMADIPVSRFAQGRPFMNVGIDFGGPFSLKTGPRRNSPVIKSYVALFVCMATKAIHLELVTELTTEAFLAALDRFVGRRGKPIAIHSDNGTNFRGAANYLSKIAKSDHLKQHEIKWIFNVPLGPNFNGLFEAGIKSVKGHMKHILKDQPFTYEELYTFLIKTEAVLNSRPLCALPGNPNDGIDVLTPGHFLIGAPLLSRHEESYDVDENISLLRRWQRIIAANQKFWKKWSSDYINTLIQRSKWTTSVENIRLDDVVLIHNASLPPQDWPLGRITKLFPGNDGVVRVVQVKTQNSEFLRPVSKVAVLPIATDNSAM